MEPYPLGCLGDNIDLSGKSTHLEFYGPHTVESLHK